MARRKQQDLTDIKEYEGEVAKVYSKFIKTAKGKTEVYSLKLEGHDDWFDSGFKEPSCEEGEYVKFSAGKNDRGYLKLDGDVVVIERPATALAKTAVSSGSGDEGVKLTKSQTDVQYNYRAATMAAIEMSNIFLTHGILPKTGKKAVTADDVLDFIEDRAGDLFRQFMNIEGLVSKLEEGDVEAEEVAPGPGDDSEEQDD